MQMYERADVIAACNSDREGRLDPLTADEGMITATVAPVVGEARQHSDDTVITRFRAALNRIRASELERLYDRLPELDEHSRQVIHQFADRLVAKMLHPPLESLRDETTNMLRQRLLAALQKLFQLGET